MTCLVPLFALSLPLAGRPAQPIVIAHRGASGYLPEHTLPGKAMAHAMGADLIEQDVVLSKDDVPVVLHDIHLDTTSDVAARFPGRQRSDGRFYAIDFTLAEMRQLCLTERFDPKTGAQVYPKRFPKGRGRFHIATLDEELRFLQGLNGSTGRVAGICPEIKQPAWHRAQGHDISRLVLDVLRAAGYASEGDPCWLQCFDWNELRRIRAEFGWRGRLLLLLGAGKSNRALSGDVPPLTPEGVAEMAKTVQGLGPALGGVLSGASAPDLVRLAHSNGLSVFPYTVRVDDLPRGIGSIDALMDRLFAGAGVDGVFTDFPDVVARWLEKRRGNIAE